MNDGKSTPNPTPFEVVAEEREGVRVLAVKGELDLSTAPQLEELVEEAEDDRLLIDLSGCEFIDSTGIDLVVRTWQRLDGNAESGGGRFALCGLSDQVRRLFEITGLATSIRTFGDRNEAIAGLSAD